MTKKSWRQAKIEDSDLGIIVTKDDIRVLFNKDGGVTVYSDEHVRTLPANQCPIKTKSTQGKPKKKRLKPANINIEESLEIGNKMPDGTIFAGVSPDTGENMFVMPQGPLGTFKWEKAMRYAADLDAYDHQDWALPTKDELNVIFNNSTKIGKAGDAFTEGGSDNSYSYWSSEVLGKRMFDRNFVWQQNFSNGKGLNGTKSFDLYVRPVRYGPTNSSGYD